MTKPTIPFGWLPGHWGLSGQTRDLAEIDYNYSSDPYTAETLRAKVVYADDALALAKVILKLELKHKKIDQQQYDIAYLEFEPDEGKKAMAAVDLLLKRGEITTLEYEKEIATLELEPWFHFDVDYIDGELELKVDCNDLYIDYLRTVGYGNDSSASDDDIIYEYVRDFGRKLSEDHPEETMNEDMMSFIKTKREANDVISKY